MPFEFYSSIVIFGIKSDFAFESEATDISTPLAQAFSERHGV